MIFVAGGEGGPQEGSRTARAQQDSKRAARQQQGSKAAAGQQKSKRIFHQAGPPSPSTFFLLLLLLLLFPLLCLPPLLLSLLSSFHPPSFLLRPPGSVLSSFKSNQATIEMTLRQQGLQRSRRAESSWKQAHKLVFPSLAERISLQP